MAFDPVTAVGNAITVFLGILKVGIDERTAQRYENDHKKRMSDLEEILDEPDSDLRASRLCAWVDGLCSAAGTPAGNVSGDRTIQLPLSHFRALCINASESIRDDQRLARLEFALKQ